MDPKLAEMYQTNQVNESDAETLAAASFAEKMASAEDLDTSGLSDEEAEQMAQDLLTGDEPAAEAAADEEVAEEESAEETAEETEETEEAPAEKTASSKEKVAQEKIAEADYLGRVMAHAYVQEQRKIAAAEEKKEEKKDDKKDEKKEDKGEKKLPPFMKKASIKVKKASEVVKEEEPSALAQLAMARAREILVDSGYELEGQEKKASEDKHAQLADKVNEMALEILKQNGFEVES